MVNWLSRSTTWSPFTPRSTRAREGERACVASRAAAAAAGTEIAAVSFEHVCKIFDDTMVLRNVSFTVPHGRMTILIGASGSGKSVLLKMILGLLRPDCGVVRVNGERIDDMTETELMRVRDDIGMLFQESALFDSLTVAENVGYKLDEETDMPIAEVRARVEEVLGFVGLAEFIDRMPTELSGGQRRRVAIARAMAARPCLLLFDEPTSGLDPITAKTVDAEILKLRDLEQVTSILVTHQLEDAFYIATHEAVLQDGHVTIVPADPQKSEDAEFIVLKDGLVYFQGRAEELRTTTDPYLVSYLSGFVPPLRREEMQAAQRALR
jgi:phospholipid/cholesterol/gamma-HCH transport system ATP-binding protein